MGDPITQSELKEPKMTNRPCRWVATAVAALAIIALTGCATGFLSDAARDSFASFMVNILSTAVNETIGP